MKRCNNCQHAEKRTASGRLHPSGGGRCTKEVKLPPLPASKNWGGVRPHVFGGNVNRREELKTDCAYFAWRAT